MLAGLRRTCVARILCEKKARINPCFDAQNERILSLCLLTPQSLRFSSDRGRLEESSPHSLLRLSTEQCRSSASPSSLSNRRSLFPPNTLQAPFHVPNLRAGGRSKVVAVFRSPAHQWSAAGFWVGELWEDPPAAASHTSFAGNWNASIAEPGFHKPNDQLSTASSTIFRNALTSFSLKVLQYAECVPPAWGALKAFPAGVRP